MPKAALAELDTPAYLAKFPGLNEALAQRHATLDDFLEAR